MHRLRQEAGLLLVENVTFANGELRLETSSPDAVRFALNWKEPGEYELKEKKPKRSLDANAYAWTLIDGIASATGVPKSEVYRNAIREVGGNSDVVCIQASAAPGLRSIWESRGLGWQTEAMPSKLKGCVNVVLYSGSSSFDTAQMSRFIDGLGQDAQSLGIETDEGRMRTLLEEWENESKKQ